MPLLVVYTASAVLGICFILLTIFGSSDHGEAGGHDGDVSHDGDFSHDADADLDASHDAAADHSGDAVSGFDWLAFFSFRFWVFFAAAFGLMGTALTLTGQLAEPLRLLVSLGMGLAVGVPVTWAMRRLMRMTSASNVSGLVGSEAQVLVSVREGQIGKIRVQLQDNEVEVPALADHGGSIERGEEVIVVGLEGGSARIVKRKEFYGE